VPVVETFSSNGPQVTRSYVVDVAEIADGFLVRFDEIETRAGGLDDDELAELLIDQAAFLPDILLTSDGGFLQFVDLTETVTVSLAELGWSADASAVAEYVAAPDFEEEIRRATVDSWYGYWIDNGSVPFGPTEPTTEQLHIGLVPYNSEVVKEGLGPTTPDTVMELPLYGPTPVGSVRLYRDERADETVLFESFGELDVLNPDVDRISEFAKAFTLLEPSTLRPLVATTMRSRTFFDGKYQLGTDQRQRRVTFDWEEAIGCATPRAIRGAFHSPETDTKSPHPATAPPTQGGDTR